MTDFLLTMDVLNGILSSLEPSYQQVQKETKRRNKRSVAVPKNIQERYTLQTPIDGCYFGLEQIIEKLQADLKVLKNLYFGEERFYNFIFPNLNPNEIESKEDKNTICQHYMNSMLRWFFLDLSNSLEAFIKDFHEIQGMKPSSKI